MPTYGAPRRHRGRLPIVLLVIVSLAVGAYFLVGRHSGSGSGGSQGFVATSEDLVSTAQSVTADAQKVQRFLELHAFADEALARITLMDRSVAQLQSIARQSSGRQQQLASAQVSEGKLAINAAVEFRQAVAFSYKLSSASTAQQALDLAIAAIEHNIQMWNQT